MCYIGCLLNNFLGHSFFKQGNKAQTFYYHLDFWACFNVANHMWKLIVLIRHSQQQLPNTGGKEIQPPVIQAVKWYGFIGPLSSADNSEYGQRKKSLHGSYSIFISVILYTLSKILLWVSYEYLWPYTQYGR